MADRYYPVFSSLGIGICLCNKQIIAARRPVRIAGVIAISTSTRIRQAGYPPEFGISGPFETSRIPSWRPSPTPGCLAAPNLVQGSCLGGQDSCIISDVFGIEMGNFR